MNIEIYCVITQTSVIRKSQKKKIDLQKEKKYNNNKPLWFHDFFNVLYVDAP